MKKYFAKYILVDGDIIPPCIVIEELLTGEKELFQLHSIDEVDYSRQKLVKLFLCSREITPEDYLVEGKIHLYHDGSNDPLKIMGEISQDATWVKDGDEFDENEVEEWQYTEKGWYLPKHLSSIRGFNIKFKIKAHNGEFY